MGLPTKRLGPDGKFGWYLDDVKMTDDAVEQYRAIARAEADLAAGRYRDFDNGEDLLASLDDPADVLRGEGKNDG